MTVSGGWDVSLDITFILRLCTPVSRNDDDQSVQPNACNMSGVENMPLKWVDCKSGFDQVFVELLVANNQFRKIVFEANNRGTSRSTDWH
jgi:hypothetical protein